MGIMRIALLTFLVAGFTLSGASLDLSRATVVAGSAERNSALVLIEEVEKRTGIRLPVAENSEPGKIWIVLRRRADAVAAEGY